MHVEHTVLSAVYTRISQVTDMLADQQRLLGMRCWTEGDGNVIGQVNTALQDAGLTSSAARGSVMARGAVWAAIGRADGDVAGIISQVNDALIAVGLTSSAARAASMGNADLWLAVERAAGDADQAIENVKQWIHGH